MTSTLVVAAVGPVQELIAAARRTRDFYLGSAFLGEISRTVARTVAQRIGLHALIFPAPESDEQLRPLRFDSRSETLEADDVSNVIVFEAGNDLAIPALITELRTAADGRWRELATSAANRCADELHDRWREQLDPSPVELFAAWAPIRDGYAAARAEAMRILAARKACRNFEPWQGSERPKSSLDAGRETVLTRIDSDRPRRRRGLHARPNEQLDLLSLVKRVDWGKDAIRYPSVSRVAIDPWVRGVWSASRDNPEIAALFEGIATECRALGLRERRDRNPWHIEDDLRKFPWLESFRYEGTVLYASREGDLIDELLDQAPAEETETLQEAREAVRKKLAPLRTLLETLLKKHRFRDPWAYLALLSADGDEMGRVLSDIARLPDGADRHREFTRAQSRFARKAREIINGRAEAGGIRISGVTVYASADDVLAFTAVDHVLHCASALRAAFAAEVGSLAERFGVRPPTLSIGIAVGHFLEPLEDLLEFARAAEKRAKHPAKEDRGQSPRNALAIAVHSRGGAPVCVRDHWESQGPPIVDRLQEWAELHRRRQLSTRAAYDLRALFRDYGDVESDELHLDALRVLARKESDSSAASALARIEKLVAKVKTTRELLVLSNELVIGQWLGDAMDQAAGSRLTDKLSGEEARR